MSLKAKLVSTIAAIALVLAILVGGVFAASTAVVNFGGNVSFSATDVMATVTGNYTGTATTAKTLTSLVWDATGATHDAAAEDTWKEWTLDFKKIDGQDKAEDIVVTVNVTNNATDRALKVKLTEAATVARVTVEYTAENDGAAVADHTLEISVESGKTLTYTITLSLDNTQTSLASVAQAWKIDMANA